MNWKCGRKRSLPNISHYPCIFLEGLRRATKTLNRDSRSPGRDMKPRPPEYEAQVLTTRQWRSVQPISAATLFLRHIRVSVATCKGRQRTFDCFKMTVFCPSPGWCGPDNARQYATLKRPSIYARLHGATSHSPPWEPEISFNCSFALQEILLLSIYVHYLRLQSEPEQE
jgi:hypothetical protein